MEAAARGGADDACSICLCELDDDEHRTNLPCGHAFHARCLATWLWQSRTCPTCRHAPEGQEAETGHVVNVTESLATLLTNLRQQTEMNRQMRSRAVQAARATSANPDLVRAAGYYRKWRDQAATLRAELKTINRTIRDKKTRDRAALRKMEAEHRAALRTAAVEQRAANRADFAEASALKLKLSRAEHRIRTHERKLIEIYNRDQQAS